MKRKNDGSAQETACGETMQPPPTTQSFDGFFALWDVAKHWCEGPMKLDQLWGKPIWYWSRCGKISLRLAALLAIFEIIGPKKLTAYAEALRSVCKIQLSRHLEDYDPWLLIAVLLVAFTMATAFATPHLMGLSPSSKGKDDYWMLAYFFACNVILVYGGLRTVGKPSKPAKPPTKYNESIVLGAIVSNYLLFIAAAVICVVITGSVLKYFIVYTLLVFAYLLDKAAIARIVKTFTLIIAIIGGFFDLLGA